MFVKVAVVSLLAMTTLGADFGIRINDPLVRKKYQGQTIGVTVGDTIRFTLTEDRGRGLRWFTNDDDKEANYIIVEDHYKLQEAEEGS